jgi:hypothetical protein
MIAIMILGLGMVMVATVFPVSLDMTRGTVQLNISQCAADAAVGTLALRVPRYNSLTPYNNTGAVASDFNGTVPTYGVLRVPLANMSNTDLPDADIASGIEYNVVNNAAPMPVSAPGYTGEAFCSLFTERSFWDSEYVASEPTIYTFVVAAQNIAVASGLPSVAQEVPPLFSTLGISPTSPRISIADRVYPPVDLYDYPTNTQLTPAQILAIVAERRYAWSAIHYRDLTTDQTGKTYICRIAILYRGDLNATYAPQDTSAGVPTATPAADDTSTSQTLFPQPWLVRLTSVSDSTGLATCSREVAQLLPAGSYFIVGSNRLSGSTVPWQGAVAKVLQNSYTASSPSTTFTLQFKPGELGVGNKYGTPASVPVWVYPPAYSAGNFGTTSPVVDVVSKTVTAW